MNDLELMERFRADVAPADPVALSRARAGMFRDHPVRRVRRSRWQLVPVAGLAAAATIAVAVTAWPSNGPPPAPDAAQLLRLAADEARQEPLLPARPDQFVFFETRVVYAEHIEKYPVPVGPPRKYTVPAGSPSAPPLDQRTQQMWLSVDGSRDGAWKGTAVGPPGSRPLAVSAKVRHGAPAYRRDLPTEVAAMRNYLYAPGEGTGTADENAWGRVGDLLHDEYLPPDTAAALFEAAATIPGTTVRPGQVDLAGRPGVAVSRVSGEVRQDLIFDPSTHRLLGERDTTVGGPSPYPKGTVVAESAQLRVAIVDRAGQLP